MDTMKICPGCQKPLAPNAPDGLCPKCLVRAGLPTRADIGPESELVELPGDPFTIQETASAKAPHGYTQSKGGVGYRYKRAAPGNRAGGHVGLYVRKSTWISGLNPRLTR